jgi:hypothetical protein
MGQYACLAVGSHVRIVGTYVYDTFHAKWMKIHHVTSITVIPSEKTDLHPGNLWVRKDAWLPLRVSHLLQFILAAGWSPPPLHSCHPLRGPSTALATATSHAFQHEDCFLDLLSFGAEFGQHLEDVHF